MLFQKSIDNSACGKLYSAFLWKDSRFREGIGYEDLDLIPILFLKADQIAKVDKTVYLYLQHPQSYIHTFSLKRADVLDVTQRLTEWITIRRPSLARAARARELNANFNIFGLIEAHKNSLGSEGGDSDKTKAMLLCERCWIKIKELRGEALRNPDVRLKTKLGILVSYIGGRYLLGKISRFIY